MLDKNRTRFNGLEWIESVVDVIETLRDYVIVKCPHFDIINNVDNICFYNDVIIHDEICKASYDHFIDVKIKTLDNSIHYLLTDTMYSKKADKRICMSCEKEEVHVNEEEKADNEE